MRINASNLSKSKVRGAEIEEGRQFTYFGSVIGTSRGTDKDIQARQRKA